MKKKKLTKNNQLIYLVKILALQNKNLSMQFKLKYKLIIDFKIKILKFKEKMNLLYFKNTLIELF